MRNTHLSPFTLPAAVLHSRPDLADLTAIGAVIVRAEVEGC